MLSNPNSSRVHSEDGLEEVAYSFRICNLRLRLRLRLRLKPNLLHPKLGFLFFYTSLTTTAASKRLKEIQPSEILSRTCLRLSQDELSTYTSGLNFFSLRCKVKVLVTFLKSNEKEIYLTLSGVIVSGIFRSLFFSSII